MQRKVCGPKTVEVRDGWRKCRNVDEMAWTGKTTNGCKCSVGKFGGCRLFYLIDIGCFSLSMIL
jgi:hypothetical protein